MILLSFRSKKALKVNFPWNTVSLTTFGIWLTRSDLVGCGLESFHKIDFDILPVLGFEPLYTCMLAYHEYQCSCEEKRNLAFSALLTES